MGRSVRFGRVGSVDFRTALPAAVATCVILAVIIVAIRDVGVSSPLDMMLALSVLALGTLIILTRRAQTCARTSATTERWLRALVTEASDALLVLDHEAHLAYSSPSAIDMLGIRNQADFDGVVAGLDEEAVSALRSEFLAVRDTPGAASVVVAQMAQAEERQLEVQLAALRDDEDTEERVTAHSAAPDSGREDDAYDRAVAQLGAGAVQGSGMARLCLEGVRRRQLRISLHNRLDDPDLRGIVVRVTDITKASALSEQLVEQALHDPLTGLPNRALFSDRLANATARHGRLGRMLAVVCLDVDHFAVINDTLGHAVGDNVLTVVASRLGAVLRGGDTAARLGGDEFAIILEESGDEDDVRAVVGRVAEEVARPCLVDGQVVKVRASMGVSLMTGEVCGADEMLRRADAALFAAKAKGANAQVVIFDPRVHDALQDRQALGAELPGAVQRGELRLLYQPIIDLTTGVVTDMEALMRWAHPRRGMISPLDFIPIAEETGVIIEMGRWAVDQALHDLAQINHSRRGKHEVGVHVNVSARQLAQPHFVEEVEAAIRKHGVSPHLLTLEITESVLMDDVALARERLLALRGLGARIGIDDFGNGWSSLRYQADFPLDVVKVDRAFVTTLETDANDRILATAIINLCHELGLITVAEGIETPVQAELLQALGCDRVQGFLYARPLTLAALVDFLADEVRQQRRARASARRRAGAVAAPVWEQPAATAEVP